MSKLRQRMKDDKGAALLWMAGSLVTLIAASAFAVDLGWIYLNNSRLQSAADAAALAGVVNLPGFTAQATADAETAAGINGFPVPGDATLSDAVLADNEYWVELRAEVPTFFLRVIGFESVAMRQEATAQYIKPVRLGSPSNQFGGPGQNFWAAINGRYTEIQQGDPYAAECIEHNGSSGPAGCDSAQGTPPYRPGGYYYAVEVGSGSTGTLSVQFYDGGHFVNGSGSGVSDPDDTSWRPGWSDRGVFLEYELFAPDPTPGDPTDNSTSVCSGSFPAYFTSSPNSTQRGNGNFNSWTGNGANNCSYNPPGSPIPPGIYVLQLPSPNYEGSSKFGIRASVSSGPAPKVYGLLDMSIHVNFTSNQAEPYLAEVRPEHAGRTLELDIWDLGDAPGAQNQAWITFYDANGDRPDCSWTSTNGESASSVSDCRINIGAQRFNEEWLSVQIPIPSDYTCVPDAALPACWWKIQINSALQPTDRTTWTARISGDPVRLID